tara:strand:- start:36 stop:329 length:294 start_codon:yes stop_codon:yes gene_type:complete
MELYQVTELIKTDPPDGGGEGSWWRYTIECGVVAENSICGTREGSRDEVEDYLNKMLDAINKRTLGFQSERLRHAHSAPRYFPVKERRYPVKAQRMN